MIGIQGETKLEEVTKSPADAELSTTSTNDVQNKVVTGEINEIKASLEWEEITNSLSWDSNLTWIARHVYKRKNELQFSITVSTNSLRNEQILVVLPTPLTQSWITCVVLTSNNLPSRIEVCEVATDGKLIFHGDYTPSTDLYIVVSGQIGLE